jgi:hypothetical protein
MAVIYCGKKEDPRLQRKYDLVVKKIGTMAVSRKD